MGKIFQETCPMPFKKNKKIHLLGQVGLLAGTRDHVTGITRPLEGAIRLYGERSFQYIGWGLFSTISITMDMFSCFSRQSRQERMLSFNLAIRFARIALLKCYFSA
jgi:hypothetical protein